MPPTSSSSSPSSPSSKAALLGPDLREALVAMVRRRVPERDVEDIVQTALTEALESASAPSDGEALRRWVFGVAKNKVVDYHRKRGRETFEVPEISEGPAPHVESDLLRWAKEHLPEGDDAHKTLDWMLREGDGEKLEAIAEAERVPAPRVRQRVSRLRRHLKTHWAREVALLAALGVAITALVMVLLQLFGSWTKPSEPIAPNIHPEPSSPGPRLEDDALRYALATCEGAERGGSVEAFRDCVDALDRAKALDGSIEDRADVQHFRGAADRALRVTPPKEKTPPSPAPLSTELGPKTKAAPTSMPTPTPLSTPPPPNPSETKLAPTKPTPNGTPSFDKASNSKQNGGKSLDLSGSF